MKCYQLASVWWLVLHRRCWYIRLRCHKSLCIWPDPRIRRGWGKGRGWPFRGRWWWTWATVSGNWPRCSRLWRGWWISTPTCAGRSPTHHHFTDQTLNANKVENWDKLPDPNTSTRWTRWWHRIWLRSTANPTRRAQYCGTGASSL